MALLRFGVFELDQPARELTRLGRRVAIAPQPFQVLSMLASRPGEVVTREELRTALWGDHTHVDFDRSLNFCVAIVRRALGDDARRPRFVETVPRRGYRFLADVHRVDPNHTTGLAPESKPISEPTRRHRGRAWVRWAAAALIAPVLLLHGPARTPLPVHTRENARPEALAAFDRGQTLFERDMDGRRRSVAAFDEARHLDDRFAEAHYALASTYLTLAEAHALPQRDALQQARAAALRAITLEDTPESRRVLGELRLVVDWDWAGARQDLERAIALQPHWDLGYATYAQFLSATGDDSGAAAAMARAESQSPGCDLLYWQAAVLHYRAREYDAALRDLARSVALGAPRDRTDRQWRINVHDLGLLIQIQRRDWTAAHIEAMALARAYGATPEQLRHFTAIRAADAVAAFLKTSERVTRNDAVRGVVPATRIAVLTALNGHDDEALAWLEQASTNRDVDLVFVLRDPALDALRRSPRFQAIEQLVRRQ